MNPLRSALNAVRRSSPFSGAGLLTRRSRPLDRPPSPPSTAGQPIGLLLLLTKAS